ncbi:chaps-domain-containing protein [Hysterangium stoloniferum]|nr:chaps-domain-containing protein [Hysterangium stoloniferum]
MDTFRDVPEFFEVELGESILARTEILATFRELGPPDLCHTVKSQGKGQRDLGTYHYVSGVDASSSASLAAYLNSLTYAVEDNAAWFSKSTAFKVRNGCFCCFNAFSRVDVRVDVKIPGGVNAYVIDLRGERHEATPEIWQETYLSALLRSILYADDPSYRLMGFRKLDPITTPEAELRFLQAAGALFSKGWQLGSDPEIQVASMVSNHLTAGILKYFGDSFRFDQAANLFEKINAQEPEVASLLAQSYIGMNEEVKAVQIMASALRDHPQSYTLLHVQCDFLRGKGKFEWALKLARQAVNCAPSEFVTWAKLTEVYIELGMYESALLTLNSCPMFTYNERDLHRMPTPQRTHLPVKQYIVDSQVLGEDREEDNEADPALKRLPAPNLRGTFARAYSLLTRLVSQIGWDELLTTRSTVFVMEEEYRMQKAQADISNVVNGSADIVNGADDNASTRAISSPAPNGSNQTSSSDIPTIRISTESGRDKKAKKTEEMSAQADNVKAAEAPGTPEETVGKPVQAAVHEDGEETASGETANVNNAEAFSFSNKRLCERWLDNLFMVLYEDLRIWTIFRAEVAHFKTQHVAYRKTGAEWEILGDLGLRLHHKEEAKEAYQRCLEAKFSVKAWYKLLDMYADEGDLLRSLQAAVRLTAYQHRYYMEMSYPTTVAHHLYKLGQVHGHGKLSYTLMSMGLPEPLLKIMEGYLRYGRAFKVEGYDF